MARRNKSERAGEYDDDNLCLHVIHLNLSREQSELDGITARHHKGNAIFGLILSIQLHA